MLKTANDEQPWGFHTYVCGKEINNTLPKMAEYFELTNEGEDAYLNNVWLPYRNSPRFESYLDWFRVPKRSMFARSRERTFVSTQLPSIHRLAFTFLNYVVTPKGGFKMNIEYHNTFYLRHLIDGSDRMFNIPFVIISHMRAAYTDGRRILPYENLISKILKANGIFPGETIVVLNNFFVFVDLQNKFEFNESLFLRLLQELYCKNYGHHCKIHGCKRDKLKS